MSLSRKSALFTLALALGAAASLFGSGKKQTTSPAAPPPNEVVVWTYDSFVSEWGPGETVAARFEAATGRRIRWVSHGDAGAMLARLILEGGAAGADVILGLDQNMAGRALASGLLEGYKPAGAGGVFPELVLDDAWRLTPLDYSYFAIIYDSETVAPPASLEDLAGPDYRDRLILMDPRTSSPGLGFLAWTQAIYGGEWTAYWERLKPSILTVADGWDSGYGLFTAGEAPLVLSYTTSPGYHLEYEGTERFKAALFAQGHPIQIEAAALLKAAPNKAGGQAFLDFMLTPAFQEVIPLTNWMYPVIDIPLPDSFRANPKAATPLRPPAPMEQDLDTWANVMGAR